MDSSCSGSDFLCKMNQVSDCHQRQVHLRKACICCSGTKAGRQLCCAGCKTRLCLSAAYINPASVHLVLKLISTGVDPLLHQLLWLDFAASALQNLELLLKFVLILNICSDMHLVSLPAIGRLSSGSMMRRCAAEAFVIDDGKSDDFRAFLATYTLP